MKLIPKQPNRFRRLRARSGARLFSCQLCCGCGSRTCGGDPVRNPCIGCAGVGYLRTAQALDWRRNIGYMPEPLTYRNRTHYGYPKGTHSIPTLD